MASSIPKEAKNDLLTAWLAATETTWKVALFLNTSNCMTQSLYSGCTNEVVGTGYTAGGATLLGRALSYDGENVVFDATDAFWVTATFTATYAIVYDTVTSKIRGRFELGGSIPVAGGTFTIQWNNPSGLFKLSS